MPPVLRVQPGDVVRLKLRNSGVLPTNVHYHGLNVSPVGAGDNVFLDIEPGITFQYDLPIPADHPQGLFWYHPHFDPLAEHGDRRRHVGRPDHRRHPRPVPRAARHPRARDAAQGSEDRGRATGPGSGSERARRRGRSTVSSNRRSTMQPGQIEFWRIGNIGANIYYQLNLGAQPFYVIAQDGNLQNQIVQTDTLLLPPGKRFELLIYGPKAGQLPPAGQRVQHRPSRRPVPGPAAGHRRVARSRSGADSAPTNFPAVHGPAQRPDRPGSASSCSPTRQPQPVRHQRQAVQPPMRRHRRPSRRRRRVDDHQHARRGARVPHPPARLPGDRDQRRAAALHRLSGHREPACPRPHDGRRASSRSIIPFTNPVIVGEFVYHCHIVQHEDQGMMANILVLDPNQPPPAYELCDPTGDPTDPGHHEHGLP